MKKLIFKLNGKEVTSAEFHRNGPVGGEGIPMIAKAYTSADPLVSDGVGCMKSQVPEFREAIQKRGIVGARVRDNGQVEFTSRRARKQVLSMRGLHDNEGGFGDG